MPGQENASLMSPVGKIKLCSPDHIGLLIHRTFNASIPRHHIPLDLWEFEHGQTGDDLHVSDTDENHGKEETNGRGRWRNRVTGDILGGTEGYLGFTVVGYDSVR
jgi:DNA-directed RNA polymerase I subunit RPA43